MNTCRFFSLFSHCCSLCMHLLSDYDARTAWIYIIGAQVYLAIAITLFHEDFGRNFMLIYLSGAVIAAATGYYCLSRIKKLEKSIGMNRFNGHVYEYPGLAIVFFLSCLGLLGFPFTPSFIGIDLIVQPHS